MEKKNGLSKIVIVFLIFVIGGLLGYIACDKLSDDKSEPKEETSNKTESNSNVTTSNTQEQTTNSYEVFAKNLKEQIKKYDANKGQNESVSNAQVDEGYQINLTSNGELYVEYYKKELATKFGKTKLADKVLAFYIIETGNGGLHMVYFIYEDGTVGKADVESVFDGTVSTIPVDKVEGYKNIVSVVQGVFGTEHSAGAGAIFIDINGNIYNPNFK